ncbi:MAG: preprotein translocase secY subunit [Dehalococcoidales bacterium]|nr:preprotein translocase secY subunit [Dehalococcoidales bacterium]
MRPRPTRPRLLQAMLDAFHLPDLRRRILMTLAILVVFRFIAHVSLPGVDPEALKRIFDPMSEGGVSGLLRMLDMFSGGMMRYFSIAALGVYPYITASIIMQLMVPVIPRLQALAQEGEAGRHKVDRITHWLTVPMAGVAGWGQLALFQREGIFRTGVNEPLQTATMILALIAGSMFLVWLGELITEYGIGNGISIIIFAGIVAGYVDLFPGMTLAAQQGQWGGLVAYLILGIATIAFIVIFTEAHRRIPVQYARMVMRGGRSYRQSGATHIPIRVNTAGMIPLIFAMSVVIFPATVASYFANASNADPNLANRILELFNPNAPMPMGLFYWGIYFFLVIAFAFFYTVVIFQQQDLAGNLQKQGGFIPGIRPGKNTATYLNGVVNRITWAGALFLALVAVLPFLAREITSVQVIQLSTMGLLIVVGVVLDTMKQMEAQLVMRRYEGFIK